MQPPITPLNSAPSFQNPASGDKGGDKNSMVVTAGRASWRTNRGCRAAHCRSALRFGQDLFHLRGGEGPGGGRMNVPHGPHMQ